MINENTNTSLNHFCKLKYNKERFGVRKVLRKNYSEKPTNLFPYCTKKGGNKIKKDMIIA